MKESSAKKTDERGPLSVFRHSSRLSKAVVPFIVVFGLLFGATQPSFALSAQDQKIANAALKLANSKKWSQALNRAVQAESELPVKFIKWLQMTDPKKDVAFSEIAAFMAHNPQWPRQSVLQRRAEEIMPETIEPTKVLKWFAGRQPLTANGHIRLTAALKALGRETELREQARKTWLNVNFGRSQQQKFYRNFRQYLTYQDHLDRLDRLLWEGRSGPARRMLPLVKKDWQRLAEARIALRRMRGGVDGAIARVPAKFKNHPGLVFERMRWRRIKGRDEGSKDLLFAMGDVHPYPHVWWRQKAVMARRAIRQGHFTDALRIVENHQLEVGSQFADAEWLAGWINLRFLKEPKTALTHFKTLHDNVKFPISKARGAYWIGRSYDDLGNQEQAQAWFKEAAQYTTAYYGQLAGERIGTKVAFMINERAVPNSQEKSLFENSELVSVVRMLDQLKSRTHMRSFIYQLNSMSTTAGWRTLVAEFAVEKGRPDLAIFVGKRAIREGHGVIEAAYPLLDKDLMRKTPEAALVHGIVRQESAFYEKAISSAGARGLMQLMPRTAYNLAKQKNYRYSKAKLTTNPKLNVWLGSEYLDDLLKKFDGSYVLTLASYNAGPFRARQWVREFGDPRSDNQDYVIDWIEQIPFDETRNYVQRVLENIQIYRHRLDTVQVASSLINDLKRQETR